MDFGGQACKWQSTILSDFTRRIPVDDVARICLDYGETEFMVFERLLMQKVWSTPETEWPALWENVQDCALKHEYKLHIERIQAWYSGPFSRKFYQCLSRDYNRRTMCHRLHCYYPPHPQSCTCGHPMIPFFPESEYLKIN